MCWKNSVFYIAVYRPYKPIYATRNVLTHLKSILMSACVCVCACIGSIGEDV